MIRSAHAHAQGGRAATGREEETETENGNESDSKSGEGEHTRGAAVASIQVLDGQERQGIQECGEERDTWGHCRGTHPAGSEHGGIRPDADTARATASNPKSGGSKSTMVPTLIIVPVAAARSDRDRIEWQSRAGVAVTGVGGGRGGSKLTTGPGSTCIAARGDAKKKKESFKKPNKNGERNKTEHEHENDRRRRGGTQEK
ncbi:hypothetical protein K438DRAFT_1755994 [Mycena galopus ATCC 62051]|nr:hypothetical protein K438DRAFT_1755994 [Mycena galopus ATCC 62051]